MTENSANSTRGSLRGKAVFQPRLVDSLLDGHLLARRFTTRKKDRSRSGPLLSTGDCRA
jgi:hypothetical protein